MIKNETCLIVNGNKYIEIMINDITIRQDQEQFSYFNENKMELAISTWWNIDLLDFLNAGERVDIYFLHRDCVERNLLLNSYSVESDLISIDLVTYDRQITSYKKDFIYIAYMRDKKIDNLLDGDG